MLETNYLIKQERDRFTVLEGEEVVAKGLLNEEDCLHAVWVINGKLSNTFYSQECGAVFVTIREVPYSREEPIE